MPKHAAPQTTEQMLTVAPAASRAALSTRKIWMLIADGTLTPYRFGARAPRVSERDVARYIARARQDGQ